ncbi:transposase [Streptomyces halstedii]|uniref:transposase n=1 Tax=Streptomyces halstedii TaxID=1944 RepID=UPI00382B70D2
MELRPGNAGANTAEDHLRVLEAALEQISGLLPRRDPRPGRRRRSNPRSARSPRILNTTRRTMRCTVGWKMTGTGETAIGKLPEQTRETSLQQDGRLQEGYFVAGLTGLNAREGRPKGMRLIVRRVRPSGRQIANLTAFEKKTGWRHSITATNIRHMWGIARSHQQPQFLDAPHRDHAEVEDRVRTNKALGLHNLPSKSWEVKRGWMLASNLAADLDARVRLLSLHDIDELADAEPDTMRFRLYHLPARFTKPARSRLLRIDASRPWAQAFTTAWQRLTDLPAVT